MPATENGLKFLSCIVSQQCWNPLLFWVSCSFQCLLAWRPLRCTQSKDKQKNSILEQWSVRWSDINLKFLSIDIIARFTSTQMVHLWWSRLKIDIRSNSQENMHDLTMFWVKNPWSSTSGKTLLFKLRDSPSPGDRRTFFGLWWLQALALATNQDAWHRGWSSWERFVPMLRIRDLISLSFQGDELFQSYLRSRIVISG